MKKTQLRMTGSSAHAKEQRQEEDFYATDPVALDLLLDLEQFSDRVWEPACGQGHLSKVLIENLYDVFSTDIIERGFGSKFDFLKSKQHFSKFDGDILTNPPYKLAQEFIEMGLDLVPEGNKVVMFLRLQFLEGKGRKEFFKKYPPEKIYISSSRILCAKNGEFEKYKKSSVTAYAWFIWKKGYTGETTIKWFN